MSEKAQTILVVDPDPDFLGWVHKHLGEDVSLSFSPG